MQGRYHNGCLYQIWMNRRYELYLLHNIYLYKNSSHGQNRLKFNLRISGISCNFLKLLKSLQIHLLHSPQGCSVPAKASGIIRLSALVSITEYRIHCVELFESFVIRQSVRAVMIFQVKILPVRTWPVTENTIAIIHSNTGSTAKCVGTGGDQQRSSFWFCLIISQW